MLKKETISFIVQKKEVYTYIHIIKIYKKNILKYFSIICIDPNLCIYTKNLSLLLLQVIMDIRLDTLLYNEWSTL